MTTLKQYLKSNGFKTRFLNNSSANFYVYVIDKEHYNNLLQFIHSYITINFISYKDFKMFVVDNNKILIKFEKD